MDALGLPGKKKNLPIPFSGSYNSFLLASSCVYRETGAKKKKKIGLAIFKEVKKEIVTGTQYFEQSTLTNHHLSN